MSGLPLVNRHILHPRQHGKRPVAVRFVRTGVPNVSYVKSRQAFLKWASTGTFRQVRGSVPAWARGGFARVCVCARVCRELPSLDVSMID